MQTNLTNKDNYLPSWDDGLHVQARSLIFRPFLHHPPSADIKFLDRVSQCGYKKATPPPKTKPSQPQPKSALQTSSLFCTISHSRCLQTTQSHPFSLLHATGKPDNILSKTTTSGPYSQTLCFLKRAINPGLSTLQSK